LPAQVRVTEAAALAAAHWLGKGDKEAADGAAVTAMRTVRRLRNYFFLFVYPRLTARAALHRCWAASLLTATWSSEKVGRQRIAAALSICRRSAPLSTAALNIRMCAGEKDNAPMLYCGERIGDGRRAPLALQRFPHA
jgi:fructose-1,6-bisphosphatase/sedoheptulose 1,7-bisphosphatase-like protein